MILHKPWKSKGQKERECASLASPSTYSRQLVCGDNTAQKRKTREVLAHVPRTYLKRPDKGTLCK